MRRAIDVDHEGHVDEAGPGRDVGEVRDPEPFGRGAWNCRLTRSSGHGAASSLIVVRTVLPRTAPLQAHGPHQARHRAAGDPDPLPGELPPDLAHAVDAEVRLEHAPDLDA